MSYDLVCEIKLEMSRKKWEQHIKERGIPTILQCLFKTWFLNLPLKTEGWTQENYGAYLISRL